MPFQPMGIQGAFVFTPVRHKDSRGHFQESFKLSSLKTELGLGFEVKQVNQSTSAKGVIRGIHFADNPPGQAKYVSCLKGAIWDVVVDLRTESPTFGKWEGVEVSLENGKSVLIAEGLGHGFLSLEEGSVVSYLCSEEYNPTTERQINPLDKDLAIDFSGFGSKFGVEEFLLSDQDKKAQGFQEALGAGLLPDS
jgi:dTDP-4-dehydrorhamnose 3,5-epimerase